MLLHLWSVGVRIISGFLVQGNIFYYRPWKTYHHATFCYSITYYNTLTISFFYLRWKKLRRLHNLGLWKFCWQFFFLLSFRKKSNIYHFTRWYRLSPMCINRCSCKYNFCLCKNQKFDQSFYIFFSVKHTILLYCRLKRLYSYVVLCDRYHRDKVHLVIKNLLSITLK